MREMVVVGEGLGCGEAVQYGGKISVGASVTLRCIDKVKVECYFTASKA